MIRKDWASWSAESEVESKIIRLTDILLRGEVDV